MDNGSKESELPIATYECNECRYYELIHGGDFKKLPPKCVHCTKPIRDRLQGHGIYRIES